MKNKKIFLLGDFRTNSGPAIANRAILETLKDEAINSLCETPPSRIIELIYKTVKTKVLILCGLSRINILGIAFAAILRKKTIYIAHGYAKIENDPKIGAKKIKTESMIFNKVDKIICVSNLLAQRIIQDYPDIKTKIIVIYNNIDKPIDHMTPKKINNQIMSTGGSSPLKNNIQVCDAISKLNKTRRDKEKIKYIIVGKKHNNITFSKYSFVEYYGEISHERCMKIMEESNLYIQNSAFETFNMSIIEAIGRGCKILTGKDTGALEVISGLNENNIIRNHNDIHEIANKINVIMNSSKQKTTVRWELLDKESVKRQFLTAADLINE